MRTNPKLRFKLIGAILHAFLLVFITILLQYINLVQPDETALYKAFAIVKHNVLGLDPKPLADSAVFLDVSKDLQLIDDISIEAYDGNEQTGGAKAVITDRAKLTTLFSSLNVHASEYRAVICDIRFEDISDLDTALKPQIEKMQRLIVASDLPSAGAGSAGFNVSGAPVTYLVNNGSFVKLPVFYDDTVKSLPAMLTELLSAKTFRRAHGLTYENDHLAFNTVIPELYYRTNDLVRNSTTKKPNLYYLGEIIQMPGFFERFLKNKYIIIGNFATDTHKTHLGSIPGPLIILNTFLTLRDKSLKIGIGWILFLLPIYFIISYFIFIHNAPKVLRLRESIKLKFLNGVLKKYVSYTGILILINLVSYLFFNNFVSLLFIATYLTLLELVIEKIHRYKKKENFIKSLKEDLL